MDNNLTIDIEDTRILFGNILKIAIRDYLFYTNKTTSQKTDINYISAKNLLFNDDYAILWDSIGGEFYIAPTIMVDIAFNGLIDIDILREYIHDMEVKIKKQNINDLELIDKIVKEVIYD